MKPVLLAILQVILASGILYGYYYLFLRNKRFHQYNRFYLLAATVISLIIPFLNIPVYFTPEEKESSFVWQTLSVFSSPVVVSDTAHQARVFTGTDAVYTLYVLIGLIVLIRMLLSLIRISRLRRNNPTEQLNDIRFIVTQEPGTPFSFFRWLFWHKEIELQSEKGEQIFRHEMFHIRQKHSLDVMFMELVTIVCWINPFFHLVKKEIKAIHEFLADQFAVQKNREWDYAELLLMQVLNTNHSLVNPFFHNQIKRRIAMITTSQKPKFQYFRKILVLPLLVVIAGLFAFSYKQVQKANLANAEKTIPDDEVNDQSTLSIYEVPLTDTPKNTVVKRIGKEATVEINIAEGEKAGKNRNPGLYIINGIQYTEEELKAKFGSKFTLETGEVLITPPNDPAAIKKYGERARNGVAEFKGLKLKEVEIVEEEKPRIFSLKTDEPLFVIDGIVKVKAESRSLLNEMNPNDIESITVLKDKTATALYGEDGANGVILVTTKKAPTKLDLTGVVVEDQPIKKVPGSEIKEVVVQGYPLKKVTGNEIEEVVVKGQPLKLKKTAGSELDEVVVEGYGTKKLGEVVIADKEFANLDVEPEFPGGETAWRKFLERNLNGEVPSKNGAKAGTYQVTVQFVIDEKGNITNIKPTTYKGYGMEDEVIRLIKTSPQWKPGMQNGHVVKAIKKQPVTFMVGGQPVLKEVTIVGTESPRMVDVKEVEKLNAIYPNPTTNSATILYSTHTAGEGEIRVYDVTSKLQKTVKINLIQGLNTVSVDMSSLAKGMYVVVVTDAEKKLGKTYKVVKE